MLIKIIFILVLLLVAFVLYSSIILGGRFHDKIDEQLSDELKRMERKNE